MRVAFVKHDVLKRKRIQAALIKLNYYNGTVDAFYGPATEKALINFATAKDLDIANPEKVFKNLLLAAPLLRYAIPRLFAKKSGGEKVGKEVAQIISQNLQETGLFEKVLIDNF